MGWVGWKSLFLCLCPIYMHMYATLVGLVSQASLGRGRVQLSCFQGSAQAGHFLNFLKISGSFFLNSSHFLTSGSALYFPSLPAFTHAAALVFSASLRSALGGKLKPWSGSRVWVEENAGRG